MVKTCVIELERARRGFELMEESAIMLDGAYGDADDTEDADLLELVLNAPTHFQDSCISFCERADACYKKALANSEGVVLGDDVARFLNGISLQRAEDLMNGQKPATASEKTYLLAFNHNCRRCHECIVRNCAALECVGHW